MSTTQKKPGRRPRSWLRRISLWVATAVTIAIGLVAGLPWIVELNWIQRRLEGAGSRILAPGGIRFNRLHVSWTRPTEILGLILLDPEGEAVVSSPHATFDWNLWKVLVTRPSVSTLSLRRAELDIERHEDGSIDLVRALEPILKDEPERTLRIRIPDGKLRLRIAGLEQPVLADHADVALDLARKNEPITWKIALVRTTDKSPTGKLDIVGSVEHEFKQSGRARDLSLSLKGDHWPLILDLQGISLRTAYVGTIDLKATGGHWVLNGDSRLLDTHATGQVLSGDVLNIDEMKASLQLEGTEGHWDVRKLDMASPWGSLAANGTYPPDHGRGIQVKGHVDLATVARQLPRTLRLKEDIRLERGTADLDAKIAGDATSNGQRIEIVTRLSDLVARRGSRTMTLKDPASLDAHLSRRPGALELERLDLKTPFLQASGQGDLDRGIVVTAALDLGAMRERLRDWVDLGGIEPSGSGKLEARYRREGEDFTASVKSELKGLALGRLPMLGSLGLDQAEATLDAKGAATPSGWPRSLGELKVDGHADGSALKLDAKLDPATRTISAGGDVRSTFVIQGEKQQAECSLRLVVKDNRDVQIDRILVTIAPYLGAGGRFLPGEARRWQARGVYDSKANELLLVTDESPNGGGSAPLPLAPRRIHVMGFSALETTSAEVDLIGDVGAIAKLAGKDGSRLSGRLVALVQAKQDQGVLDLGLRADLRDMARLSADGGFDRLGWDSGASLRARFDRNTDRIEITELGVVTPYGRIQGSGPITRLGADPTLDLKGSLSPDWMALTSLLSGKVEPRASITGQPSDWHVAGEVHRSGIGDILAAIDAHVGVNLEQVDVFGMRLAKASVVLRSRGGKINIDPIESILNGGRLHLEPELIKDAAGLSWLHLGTSSTLADATVNDEVSHRVLSYVAPVLDQATRVQGRVSFELTDARFPLDTSGGAQAKVEGDVQFDEVEFMPGPLANQIIGVFRQEVRPLLYLRDPVSIRIMGRRVYQEGLAIPLGNVAVIGLEGWADFDQNIHMLASFAASPPRQNIPVLSDILASTRVQVPITGTFKKPRIDGAAIKERFKDLSSNLLETTLDIGANGLQRLLRGRQGDGGPPTRPFLPPFRSPIDEDEQPSPPQPGPDAGANRPPPDGRSRPAPDVSRRPSVEPSTPKDGVSVRPDASPDSLTPAELRQLKREERRQKRMDKRSERRMRNGQPPD